jgi:hypothetical protein
MKKIKSFCSYLNSKFFSLNAPGKIFVLVMLIVLGYLIYKNSAKKSSNPQYQTAVVGKKDIISSISESGTVASP